MRNYLRTTFLLFFLTFGMLMAGCATDKPAVTAQVSPPPLTTISQIESFNVETACRQALEVVNNNPYEQGFFEKVFARLVNQCRDSKSPANADAIWGHFVVPLKQSGKVPPDLATTMWNYYFSRSFVSLPSIGPVNQYCGRLAEIKKDLEKEYQLKKLGFEVTQQGSPDANFLNAMYVYNTMWASCHSTDQ